MCTLSGFQDFFPSTYHQGSAQKEIKLAMFVSPFYPGKKSLTRKVHTLRREVTMSDYYSIHHISLALVSPYKSLDYVTLEVSVTSLCRNLKLNLSTINFESAHIQGK